MLQILDNYTRVHTLSMRVLKVFAARKEVPEGLEKASKDPELNRFITCIAQHLVESSATLPEL